MADCMGVQCVQCEEVTVNSSVHPTAPIPDDARIALYTFLSSGFC